MDDDEKKLTILTNLNLHYPRQQVSQFSPFAGAVRTIIGQQTNRPNVQAAMTLLRPYLAPSKMDQLSLPQVNQLIAHIRFHQHKASYLKAFTTWYLSHGGKYENFIAIPTPQLRKELLSLPGIGNETADTILLYTFKRRVFIADRYAMQLFNRLGFGPYQKYLPMQAEFAPLVIRATYDTVRNWHFSIDQHSHAYNLHPEDESWLLVP